MPSLNRTSAAVYRLLPCPRLLFFLSVFLYPAGKVDVVLIAFFFHSQDLVRFVNAFDERLQLEPYVRKLRVCLPVRMIELVKTV